MASDYERKQKEADLRNELSTCLTSHWRFCVAGVAAGLHVGIVLGRRGLGGAFDKHLPYVLGGSLGQVADWNAAEKECAEFQDRLDAFLRQST